MKIRKATLKDIERVDEIYVGGSIDEGRLQFPKVSKKAMVAELEKYRKERVKGFKKEMKMKNNYWIVVENNNCIVGVGQAWLKGKEIGMIEKVYVDKKARGKGIGVKIIKDLIKWLRSKKVKHIESSLYWSNVPSRKLHEKVGFKPSSLKMRLK